MEQEGFAIEVSSRYAEWWRYNVALMCGVFDAAGSRTDFVSVESHVADVGANLTQAPDGVAPARKVRLTTGPADHLMFYLYIVPHTLPAGTDIDATRPFDITLTVSYAGKRLLAQTRPINQWSGASVEMRIEQTPSA